MKAEVRNTSAEEISRVAMNFGSTAIGAGAGVVGATTTACSGVRTVQQLVWAALSGADAGGQQLCAHAGFQLKQLPRGAISATINRMATAPRWKTPCNMVSAYHGMLSLL
jgi:hypothetical protein